MDTGWHLHPIPVGLCRASRQGQGGDGGYRLEVHVHARWASGYHAELLRVPEFKLKFGLLGCYNLYLSK